MMTSVFEKSQQGLFSNPNVLINSCLRENQRGQDSYAADGFTFDRLWIETGSGACSITRTANNYTTDPFKAPYYATLDVTTAGDYIGICLTSEDSRRFRGNPTMTLSFWYRLVGRDITIDEHHGNGGANWDADTTTIATLPQTGSWTKFETTFNVADWANSYDPDDIFLIGIRQRDTGDTPFTLRIADMKLEFGSIATPWMMEDESYNINRCQRFYFNPPSMRFAFPVYASGYGVLDYQYPVRMRKAPSFSFSYVDGSPNTGWTEFNQRNSSYETGWSTILRCTAIPSDQIGWLWIDWASSAELL